MGCCGRDCCNPKRGTGKCLVFFFAILFGLGVIVSTSSPNWIAFSATDDTQSPAEVHEVEWGPFYGMYRTCVEGADCGKWISKSIDLSDCEDVDASSSSPDVDSGKLCNHLATWRLMGVICLCLVVIGGGLVFAASCCQVFTCGCCGNSLTCIANVLFGLEVALSIVAWAFAISSLELIKEAPAVSDSGYQWGFWLFIASGTVVGALATWMADWAAEDSCLKGIWHCVTCKSCRNKDRSDDDDRGEPLIGDSSAVLTL